MNGGHDMIAELQELWRDHKLPAFRVCVVISVIGTIVLLTTK